LDCLSFSPGGSIEEKQKPQHGVTPYTENALGRDDALNRIGKDEYQRSCQYKSIDAKVQGLSFSSDAVKDITNILRSLPSTFSESLVQHMSRKKYTVETLAERSLASAKTIQRMRNDESYTPKIGTIVAVCIALQLHPILSGDLIKKSGLSFKCIEKHIAYQFLLSTHFQNSIYECNKKLEFCGFGPIGREE
jgi:DNA-binding Xre family transcriptional regulator